MEDRPGRLTNPTPDQAIALERAGQEHRRDAAVDAVVREWATVIPGLDGEVRAITARIARIDDRLRACTARILDDCGLNDNEFRLLAGLMRLGPPHCCPPGELAGRYVPVTSGGMTGIVNRLERRELVERRPHAHDGRTFQIGLTTAGETLTRTAMERLAAMEARLMSGLGDAERRAGNAFLGALLRSIEAAL